MIRRRIVFLAIVVTLLISGSGVVDHSILAQSQKPGRLEGKIVDSQTGEGLPMVTVLLMGTKMGAATDLDGHYVILNVPSGVYEMRFSMIGYAQVTVTELKVKPGEGTILNAALP